VATKQISVERFSVTSSRPFAEVIKTLEGSVSHPDMGSFMQTMKTARSFAELESFVGTETGASGLMQFARFDLGAVVRKERGEKAPQSVRYLIGNPLIMKRMLEHVPDAGSYAPVTILVDERDGGVRLSYDRMSSFLASYENAKAMSVAKELDAKIEALLTKAAA
jgi:uncharacterized protein (DUF302 family)